MIDFEKSYKIVMKLEGGYVLHHVRGDKGGVTYAGISRRYNPYWNGWIDIDNKDFESAKGKVKEFYRRNYWDKINGNNITHQIIADVIFSQAVNSGVKVASILAQVSSKSKADGNIGNKTLNRINVMDIELFTLRFTLLSIVRRLKIVRKHPEQIKFLVGWIKRDLIIGGLL